MDGAHPGPFVCALRSPVSIVKETLLNMQSWMLAGHSRAEKKKGDKMDVHSTRGDIKMAGF